MQGPWLPCRCGGCYRIVTAGDASVLHSLPVCAALLEVRDVPTLLAWHLANKASVAALSRSEPLH